MEIHYSNKKLEEFCTKLSKATKKLGKKEAISLNAVISFLTSAKNLNDLKQMKKYRVHTLQKKKGIDRTGQVSVSIPSSAYRIILIPLNKDMSVWDGNDELLMYSSLRIVKIREVVDYHE